MNIKILDTQVPNRNSPTILQTTKKPKVEKAHLIEEMKSEGMFEFQSQN